MRQTFSALKPYCSIDAVLYEYVAQSARDKERTHDELCHVLCIINTSMQLTLLAGIVDSNLRTTHKFILSSESTE